MYTITSYHYSYQYLPAFFFFSCCVHIFCMCIVNNYMSINLFVIGPISSAPDLIVLVVHFCLYVLFVLFHMLSQDNKQFKIQVPYARKIFNKFICFVYINLYAYTGNEQFNIQVPFVRKIFAKFYIFSHFMEINCKAVFPDLACPLPPPWCTGSPSTWLQTSVGRTSPCNTPCGPRPQR